MTSVPISKSFARNLPEVVRAKLGPVRSKSKYGNVRTEVDGIKFHSKEEANRYLRLKDAQAIGHIKNLQLQVPFPIVINGFQVCKYIADFVYAKDGQKIVEDVKGFRTDVYKLKALLVEASYGIRIREVKANDKI